MFDRRFLLVAVLLVAAFAPFVATPAAAAGCSFPVTRTDATGERVTIGSDPERVVTLNPSAAQTMYEIGAWDQVVGISSYASNLPESGSKTTVGSGWGGPTVENTIALQPDLVLVPNTIPDSQVTQLRNAGLTVYKFEKANGVDDIIAKTRLTGRLVGECQAGDDRADEMEHDLEVIGDAVAGVSHPRVLFDLGFGYTVGQGSFIHDVVQRAGARNVVSLNDTFGGIGNAGYYKINPEAVVAEDPAWFIRTTGVSTPNRVPAGPNGAYTETTAYKRGNVVVVDDNAISRPAPRIVDALTTIVQALHPERYRESVEGELEGGSDALGGEMRVTSTARGRDVTALRARNLGRTRRVSFSLPDDDGDGVRLDRLNVSLSTINPTFTLTVRRGAAVENPPPAMNGTYAFSRFQLRKDGIYDADIARLTVRFRLNRSRLDARDAARENVTLYRHDGTSWSALQTRYIGEENGSLAFEAQSPGASVFVVGVPETDAAAAKTPTPTAVPTPTATPTPTTEATPTPTATTGESTETTAPGFGVAAALVALGAFVWRRRR